jgi:NADH:ubiquinone oxidoreductase subunit F (NADH-binding)
MSAALDATGERRAPTDAGPPVNTRLLSSLSGPDLAAHAAAYGACPRLPRGRLVDLVEQAGLTGRGGAAFPTHRKLRAVAAGSNPVVVGNGAEGEPASSKDRVLLSHVPHLVLDGLQLVAEAVGARRAYLYVPGQPGVVDRVRASVHQRRNSRGAVPVEVVVAPDTFVAGQETAVVSRVAGGPPLPRLPVPPVYQRGVRGRPTLVQNVETLAHIALVARYGPGWFRSVGTAEQPGTMLCTVVGAVHRPGVVELAAGTAIGDVLASAGGTTAPLGSVLVGGYHGAWLPMPDALGRTLSDRDLQPYGGAVGAGVVAALPEARCGLAETAEVVAYLAAESAGQCGPCLNGLPAIAGGLAELALPRPRQRVRADVERWCGLVARRGACAHPDGTVRLVRSALLTFAEELRLHEAGRCSGTIARPVLPVVERRPAASRS